MKKRRLRIMAGVLAASIVFMSAPQYMDGTSISTVFAAESVTVDKTAMKLSEDKTVEGDLILSGESIDLNGHTLTVTGDFWHKAGVMKINNGTLIIKGSYELRASSVSPGIGELQMQGETSLVDIDGNFIIDSKVAVSSYQWDGKVRVGGDMKVYSPDNGKGYNPGKNLLTEFKGEDKVHEVYFSDSKNNFLSNVAVENGSSLKITGAATGFNLVTDAVFENGSKISGEKALDLNGHSVVVNGEFTQAGTLPIDLGGGKMRIDGDFWQQNGIMKVAGGELSIGGNYELRSSKASAGNGELQMQGETSLVDIDGNFTIDSKVAASSYQWDGKVRVGGDMKVSSPDNGKGYNPGKNLLTEFKGEDKVHEVYFSESKNNFLSNVAVEKGSSLKLTGATTGFNLVTDAVFEGESKISGGNALNLNGNSVFVRGEFTQAGTLSIDLGGGKMRIADDFWQQNGIMKIAGGELSIGGNYELRSSKASAGSGELQMQGEKCLVDIDGSFMINSNVEASSYQWDGKVRVGGDMNVYSPDNGKGYTPGTNLVTEFKGAREHKVNFSESKNNFLSNVMLTGGSLKLTGETTGFNAVSDIVLAADSSLSGENNMNLNGHTMLAEGDFIQKGKLPIDLGGGKMIISGDYWQQNGIMKVAGGELIIGGNYELRSSKASAGSGELQMQGEKCLVDIDGDLTINSNVVDSSYQWDGKVRVGGNMKVYSPDNGKGYTPGNLLTEFKGKDKIHEVYFAENENNFLSNVAVEEGSMLKLTGNTTGFNAVSDITFANDSSLSGERQLNLNGHTFDFKGNLIHDGIVIDINGGKMLIAGDYWQRSGVLKTRGGVLNIQGNYQLRSSKASAGSGELQMQGEKSAVIVGESFIVNSTVKDSSYQWDGTISVGGNLTVNSPDNGKGFTPGENIITEFRGGNAHTLNISNKNNSISIVMIGVGDNLKLEGTINGIGITSGSKITAEPAGIVEIVGASIIGKEAGNVTVSIDNNGTVVKIPVKVGATEAESVYEGEIVDSIPAPENVMGDVNGDGKFNIADAVLFQKWLLGNKKAELAKWENADFTGDKKLDSADYALMKKALTVDKAPEAK